MILVVYHMIYLTYVIRGVPMHKRHIHVSCILAAIVIQNPPICGNTDDCRDYDLQAVDQVGGMILYLVRQAPDKLS